MPTGEYLDSENRTDDIMVDAKERRHIHPTEHELECGRLSILFSEGSREVWRCNYQGHLVVVKVGSTMNINGFMGNNSILLQRVRLYYPDSVNLDKGIALMEECRESSFFVKYLCNLVTQARALPFSLNIPFSHIVYFF